MRDIFEAVVTVEMLCDRFGSMYVRENVAKLDAYRPVIKRAAERLGRYFREGGITIDELMFLEQERASGRFAATLVTQFPGIEAADVPPLESELVAIETSNLYVRKFGVSPLISAERHMYVELLSLLQEMDRKSGGGEILYYASPHHRAKSWAYYITLISKHLSITR